MCAPLGWLLPSWQVSVCRVLSGSEGIAQGALCRAQGVCSEVRVEREKSVLKQGAVQHLYGRLAGTLSPNKGDADLLVCLWPAA